MHALPGEPSFRIQRRHAPGSCRGDRLSVITVGDVPRGEDTFDAGIRPEWLRVQNVALVVDFHLSVQEIGVRGMSDRTEHSRSVQFFDGARLQVLQS